MMLSGAPYALDASSFMPSAVSAIDVQTVNFPPEASTGTLGPVEGGFVSSNGALSNANGALLYPQSSLGSGQTLADWLADQLVVPAGGSVVLSSYDTTGTGGFAPRIIGPAVIASDSPSVAPSEAGEGVATVVPEEGGLISIPPTIAAFGSGVATNQVESAMASLRMNKVSQRPAMTTSVPEIAGEWARAAVFEIAGGEPIAERAREVEAQDESVATATPFSAPSRESSAADREARSSTRQLSPGADAVNKPVSSTEPDVSTSQPMVGGVSAWDLIDGDVTGLQSQTGNSLFDPSSSALASAQPIASQHDLAAEAAFNQIGDGDHAVPTSSADRVRLQSWLSGTPLLLMLALERITARSSRRRRPTDSTVEVVRAH
jgi:hypothetical protein